MSLITQLGAKLLICCIAEPKVASHLFNLIRLDFLLLNILNDRFDVIWLNIKKLGYALFLQTEYLE